MSHLFDQALPGNKIPRVYCDTGIEFNMIRNFVKKMQETDDRIEIVRPGVPIRKMLEEDGWPFKSKVHSRRLRDYQTRGTTDGLLGVQHYLDIATDGKHWTRYKQCPKMLRYQFTPEFKLKVSEKCCDRLKKEPMAKWSKENNKKIAIIGIRAAEQGQRQRSNCIVIRKGKVKAFQPLVPCLDEWMQWYTEEFGIELCDIYKPPYNRTRTGCRACPFARDIQEELDMLKDLLPAEYKAAEALWEPVYTEYRRIGYRLRRGS